MVKVQLTEPEARALYAAAVYQMAGSVADWEASMGPEERPIVLARAMEKLEAGLGK